MKTQFHMYQWLLICIIILTGFGTVHADDACGFDNHTMWYQSTNTNARTTATTCEKPDGITLVLPVVAHVINESGSPLITREQMDSAMARINRDFANTNGFGPDTKIRFVWATRDTNGNPFDGVTYIDGSQWPAYVQHGIAYMPTDKGIPMEQLTQYNFPIDRYVNVFIVNKITGLNGSFISGTIGNNNLIVEKTSFSQNWRTFAHEMGHFFGLWHTFSETGSCWPNNDCTHQGDGICDTPPYKLGETPSTGSVCYAGDISDSYYNVMGNSMTNSRFTAGQGQKMYSVVRDYLWPVVTGDAVIPTTATNELAIDALEHEYSVDECNYMVTPRVTLRNIGNNTVTSFQIQIWIDGILVTTSTKNANNFPSHTTRVFDLDRVSITPGNHDVKYIITKVNNTNDYFPLNNEICGTVYGTPLEYSVKTNALYGYTTGDGNYPCGTQVNITTTPYDANEFRFEKWVEGDSVVSTSPNYSFVITQNRVFNAIYITRSYTITATTNPAQGTVSDTSRSYVYGTTITVTATPLYGYEFVGWYENGNLVSTKRNYSFTVKRDRNLVAMFQPVSFTITANSDSAHHGSTTGSGTYSYNTEVILLAHASSGYRFVHWTEQGNIVSTDSIYHFIVTGDRNLIAIFEKITTSINHQQIYTLSVYPNPATNEITLDGFQNYKITLYHNSGDMVFSKTSNSGRLDISDIPSGMYFIQMNDGKKLYRGKLIKL